MLILDLDQDSQASTWANDEQRKHGRNMSNCEFRLIETNGLWMCWMINTRKINSGDQLLVKYGKWYWKKYGHLLQ